MTAKPASEERIHSAPVPGDLLAYGLVALALLTLIMASHHWLVAPLVLALVAHPLLGRRLPALNLGLVGSAICMKKRMSTRCFRHVRLSIYKSWSAR